MIGNFFGGNISVEKLHLYINTKQHFIDTQWIFLETKKQEDK